MIDIFDGQIIFDNDQLESLVQKRMVTVNGIEHKVKLVDHYLCERDQYDQEVKTVIAYNGKCYVIDWVWDLTDAKEHMYNPPYEVKPKNRKKMIEYIEWEPVE